MARTAVDTVAALAVEAGLRPATLVAPYKGSVEVVLDKPGAQGPYGAVVVGIKSGKVLRGSLTYGSGKQVKANGYDAVKAMLRAAA